MSPLRVRSLLWGSEKNFLPERMDVGCAGRRRLSAQIEITSVRKIKENAGNREPLHRKRSPSPFRGGFGGATSKKGSPERGAGTRSVTEGLICFPAEIIFIRKKRLVNARKTWYEWYDISIEANKKAGHGRCLSPMPLLCRRSVSPTQ